MYMVFGWGKDLKPEDLKYEVTSYNLPIVSSDDYGGRLGNCLPGTITINLQIPVQQGKKPATDLYRFAKNQHDAARENGAGKIAVYEGREVGQPIQVIAFDKAWITNIGSMVNQTNQHFQLQLTILAGVVEISDVKFEDQKKIQLIAA